MDSVLFVKPTSLFDWDFHHWRSLFLGCWHHQRMSKNFPGVQCKVMVALLGVRNQVKMDLAQIRISLTMEHLPLVEYKV